MDGFDSIKRRQDIHGLSDAQCLTFALLCCERHRSCYAAFSALESWGNRAWVEQVMDTLWLILHHASTDPDALQQLPIDAYQQELVLIAPDTEDFHCVLTTSALEMLACLELTLRYIQSRDQELIVTIATTSLEIIYGHLQLVTAPLHLSRNEASIQRDWVLQSPLLLQEYTYQLDDLHALRTQPLTLKLLETLRKRSAEAGIQPILRGFVPNRLLNPSAS